MLEQWWLLKHFFARLESVCRMVSRRVVRSAACFARVGQRAVLNATTTLHSRFSPFGWASGRGGGAVASEAVRPVLSKDGAGLVLLAPLGKPRANRGGPLIQGDTLRRV